MRTRLSLLALLFTLFTPIAHAQPGSLDLSFNPGAGFNGPVNALVVQSDDKLICVGQFTTYQGVSRRGIVRINVDGSIDNTFTTGTGFASVSPPNFVINAVALQADGKILCGGIFNSYNGTARKHMLRLNANGSIDLTFGTTTGGPNGNVLAVIVDPSGKIFCGGIFTTYDGQTRHLVAKLNSNGTVSNGFTTGSGFGGTALRVSTPLRPHIRLLGWRAAAALNSYRGTVSSLSAMNSNGETSTNWYGGRSNGTWEVRGSRDHRGARRPDITSVATSPRPPTGSASWTWAATWSLASARPDTTRRCSVSSPTPRAAARSSVGVGSRTTQVRPATA